MPAQLAPLQLDFEVRGAGEPVIFIAGANDDRHGWDLNVPAFEGFRVITFDNRDVGPPSWSPASYDIRDMAVDTLSVLDRAGVGSAHLVGHSLGSLIAQNVYFAAPERVRSLTLVGSWARPDHFLAHVIQGWQRWADALGDDDLVASCALYWLGQSAVNAWGMETIVAEFRTAMQRQGREAFKRQLDAALSHDSLDRLGDIRVPTHVVWGEEERTALENHSVDLVRGIPGATLTRIAGAGHSPTVETPEAFNAAIRGFIGARVFTS